MHLLGIFLGWGLGNYRASLPGSQWTRDEVSDLIFYAAFGVIMGGRIGYVLFYSLPQFIASPLTLFKIWQGGMSFHGGLLGVAVALYLFSRKTQKSFLGVGDFIAPLVPLGLAAGRIGNFINGELWGRVTDVPWGMVFSHVDSLVRHPSQLYEFFLEGILLFLILWIYSSKPRQLGSVSGVFLIGYSCVRIFVELFRQPDPQFSERAFGLLTMGQLLSIPMLIIGILLLFYKPVSSKEGSI